MAYETPGAEWRALLTGEHTGAQMLRRQVPVPPIPAPMQALLRTLSRRRRGSSSGPGSGRGSATPALQELLRGVGEEGVGGAEVELSMLFADIRGSTGLGERLRPAEFTALLNTFYRIASDAIVSSSGMVDKFVGDEAIGLFIPRHTGAPPRRGRDCRGQGDPRSGRSRRCVGVWFDSGWCRRPHGNRVRRHGRIQRGDFRLHGARRQRQHHGSAGLIGGGRRAAGFRRGGRVGGHDHRRSRPSNRRCSRPGGRSRRLLDPAGDGHRLSGHHGGTA